MAENNHNHSNEKFMADLKQFAKSKAFSELTKKAEHGSHPSDQMLYDYVLGETDDAASRMIRSHIAVCSACSQEVLQFRGIEEEIENELIRRFEQPPLINKVSQWFSKITFNFKSARNYIIPGFAVATACLIFLIWYGKTPETGRLVSNSYQAVISMTGHIEPKILFPWEYPKQTFGFSSADTYSLPAKAFGAGLFAGRQELAGNINMKLPESLLTEKPLSSWEQSEWNHYFIIGKWSMLLKNVCLSESFQQSSEFWKQQQTIFQNLHAEFKKKASTQEASYITAFFDQTKPLISGVTGSMGIRECHTIVFEIDRLIGKMF